MNAKSSYKNKAHTTKYNVYDIKKNYIYLNQKRQKELKNNKKKFKL